MNNPNDTSKNDGELFIGLVGATGSNLNKICRLIKKELKEFRYKTEIFKISHLISKLPNLDIPPNILNLPKNERVYELMEAGNRLRKRTKRNDAAVLITLSKLRKFRREKREGKNVGVPKQAYIFNSLKTPDEITRLRKIYGDRVIIISVYEPKYLRIKRLNENIVNDNNLTATNRLMNKVIELIEKDEDEKSNKYGQKCKKSFSEADIFIDASNDELLQKQIKRSIELIFRKPVITPTIEEYCMYHAKSSSFRSADLSRQVGCVIASQNGEILVTGCNEVPIYGGGAFWSNLSNNSDDDYRDYRKGYDKNKAMTDNIIYEFFRRMTEKGLIYSKFRKRTKEKILDLLVYDENAVLEETKILDLTEFGRIVHAEMSAITDAARNGICVKDGILYCTTFPCHNCSKHILSSGIKEVIYIEPYDKSLAKDMYPEHIYIPSDDTQSVEPDCDCLIVRPFIGVAPRIYSELFDMKKGRKRKNKKGELLDLEPGDLYFIASQLEQIYIKAETSYTAKISLALSDAGIKV